MGLEYDCTTAVLSCGGNYNYNVINVCARRGNSTLCPKGRAGGVLGEVEARVAPLSPLYGKGAEPAGRLHLPP